MDEALDDILRRLREFVEFCQERPGEFHRRWLRHSQKVAQVYVRVAMHDGMRCLEIGDVEFGGPMWNSPITKAEYEWAKRFFEAAHDINTLDATSVDTVVDHEIAGYLLTHNWTVQEIIGGVITVFFKPKAGNKHAVTHA